MPQLGGWPTTQGDELATLVWLFEGVIIFYYKVQFFLHIYRCDEVLESRRSSGRIRLLK
jgi:hypothetical protein